MTAKAYTIAPEGRSITCHRCGRTSYSRVDVEQRYCAFCKVFHDDQQLAMWTIYDHPTDHPDMFVARKWLCGPGSVPTNDMFVAPTLDEVRALLPPGLVCLARSYGDDPKIVETWI